MSGTVVDDRRWTPGVEWLVDGDGCWADNAKTEEAEQTGEPRVVAGGVAGGRRMVRWCGRRWRSGVGGHMLGDRQRDRGEEEEDMQGTGQRQERRESAFIGKLQ